MNANTNAAMPGAAESPANPVDLPALPESSVERGESPVAKAMKAFDRFLTGLQPEALEAVLVRFKGIQVVYNETNKQIDVQATLDAMNGKQKWDVFFKTLCLQIIPGFADCVKIDGMKEISMEALGERFEEEKIPFLRLAGDTGDNFIYPNSSGLGALQFMRALSKRLFVGAKLNIVKGGTLVVPDVGVGILHGVIRKCSEVGIEVKDVFGSQDPGLAPDEGFRVFTLPKGSMFEWDLKVFENLAKVMLQGGAELFIPEAAAAVVLLRFVRAGTPFAEALKGVANSFSFAEGSEQFIALAGLEAKFAPAPATTPVAPVAAVTTPVPPAAPVTQVV